MLTNKQIGLRIKSVREEKDMTLQEIADKIGVAKSTIQRYEVGSIANLKLPIISSIANVLDVDPSWIIGKTDIQKPQGQTNYELEGTYFNFAKEMQEKEVSGEDMEKLWQFYEMIKKK